MQPFKISLLLTAALLSFSACSPEELEKISNQEQELIEEAKPVLYEPYEHNSSQQNDTIENQHEMTLTYLNKQRIGAGLTPYTFNNKLNLSAYNHAWYQYYDDQSGCSHKEDPEQEFFTGEWGRDRAAYVGYSAYGGEGVSYGRKTMKDAISSLMTAIYHRFGLLSMEADEIGFGIVGKDFVYNRGNKEVEALCQSDENYYINGSYYGTICIDGKRLPSSLYQYKRDHIKKASAKAILYPYENQLDFEPIFDNYETPDPLPDLDGDVGNPISIQFNDYDIDTVVMHSFELYENNTTLLSDVRILTQETDPNQRFDNYEYALFSMQPLNGNSWYKVKAAFDLDGTLWDKTWYFKTEK